MVRIKNPHTIQRESDNMNSLAVSSLVFVLSFGAALAAIVARRRLPEQHLSFESKDVLKIGMALIASLAALVLGMLIATAKGNYDAQENAVKELAAKIILLETVLAKYGTETKEIRGLLRKAVESTHDQLWPASSGRPADLTPGEARASLESMFDQIAALSPQTDAQRVLKTRSQDGLLDLAAARIRLYSQQDSELPVALLVVLVFWFMLLFFGYGLLTPGNATLVTMFGVCALSVCGAMFLLMEFTSPFNGIMRVSDKPVKNALLLLGQ